MHSRVKTANSTSKAIASERDNDLGCDNATVVRGSARRPPATEGREGRARIFDRASDPTRRRTLMIVRVAIKERSVENAINDASVLPPACRVFSP